MPEPIAKLRATPVWTRDQIEPMREKLAAKRIKRAKSVAHDPLEKLTKAQLLAYAHEHGIHITHGMQRRRSDILTLVCAK
jgi:hypothetical protein